MKIYDISGSWSFSADSANEGIEKKFFLGSFDDEITLPNTVSAAQKGEYNTDMSTGYLSDPYYYEGYAWFSREIVLDDYSADNVYTLKLERTRVSHIWIDGEYAGSMNSLCTSHLYDITALAKPSFKLTVMVDNTDYPTRGGHMTSPDTQTNWNGILGEISITSEVRGVLRDITIAENYDDNTVTITACASEDISAEITSDGAFDAASAVFKNGQSSVQIKCRDNIEKWSEFTPRFYNVTITAANGNTYKTTFGMKKLETFRRENNSYGFKINGKEIILRGKHDGMIFPMTGYAPTDVEGWLKVMQTAKSYGINHYRFHTCCPPDAAFTAADMLGIYMEPELPFWGTIHGKDDKDFNAPEQEYLISEGFGIIKEFGHHPSFVMMSLGNELWGSADRLSEIIGGFKEVNDRILYTGGSNNFQFFPTEVPNEDFFVGVRFDKEFLIRGSYAMCDAPLGFVQTDKPNTVHNYDVYFSSGSEMGEADENGEIEIQYGTGVKKVKTNGGGRYIPQKPVVSHEVGQYYTYPDYDEIDKYTGVLKARNLEVFRDRLNAAGMGEYAKANFMDSGRLAAQCYKLEIEAARRSRCLSGYQLLDIQDFTGQGTAMVGILNSFMEPKGIISREEWNYFNGETVIMAAFPSFVLYDGDEFSAEIIVSHFGSTDISGMTAEIDLLGKKYAFSCEAVKENGVYTIGIITADISAEKQERGKLSLKMGDIRNEYELYLFPKQYVNIGDLSTDNLFVTADKFAALEKLSEKKNVLLVTENVKGIDSVYCTDFWNFGMFRSISESMGRPVPTGTLGISARNTHSALKGFISDTYTTPQWYDIITNSRCMVLDGTDIDPIVRTIDNVERNHKLALLFEAKCGGGNIIVCAADPDKTGKSPELSAYIGSIAEYAASEDFKPDKEISPERLTEILF
ncbi:MAG: beta-glucuronidase [Oscillospiraceae bacterium]|nr:beta-glucuronidase [Oscillospiraceae bacterium]